MLTIGLLLHNVFEGMSIGVQSSVQGLSLMLIAVCSHKVVVAFSLGLSFHRAQWKNATANLAITLFLISGPLGTVVGILVAQESPPIVSAVLISLTLGTFL
mmetsp:Transcript_93211/g.201618  ORF Transcript_93211/g.201618 Transcript_93211/m.201618 type:complete len:101 (+) Transcript_93211:222-524(+)